MPVANPDGYDFTFEPGQRLWRKNLRDNNGDGQITAGDGVDLNRNFADKWGYDNEGSSPDPVERDLPRPGPELRARDQGARRASCERVGFEFFVNYHSAAELLLYGTGWQVATPTPDDVIYEAMAGDDANPAVPGYDPDISAELYTTNGDTDTHMTENVRHARLHARDVDVRGGVGLRPGRRVGGRGLRQRLRVPRRRGRSSRPSSRRTSRSRSRSPSRPTTRTTRSRSSAATRRELPRRHASTSPTATRRRWPSSPSGRSRACSMHYRINGGRTRTADVSRVARRRALRRRERRLLRRVPRRRPRRRRAGDRVKVWFSGTKTGQGRRSRSERFTYTRRPRHRRTTCSCSPTRTTRASTRPTRRARPRPSTRGATRRAIAAGRLQRRRLGRRRAGRAARPRRARPLRRGRSGTSATTGSRRTPRTS